MTRRIILSTLAVLLFSGCAHGKARKIDDFHWEDVERVVAISDLHGDYEQYIKVMQSAGLSEFARQVVWWRNSPRANR